MKKEQDKTAYQRYQMKYYHANKAKAKAAYKARYNKVKHKPVVYLLIDEDYVGTTERISYRLANHKNKYNRSVDYRVLAEFNTRAEALELEAFLHELGYKGKHNFNSYK